MRVVLLMKGKHVRLRPKPTYAEASCDCPECGQPLRVQGKGQEIGGRDYYRADGFCAECGKRVGEIRAYVNTIFGLEEDEAVLVHGRARVY